MNKKAEEGWALVSAFGIRYTFENCQPGEYTYKIMYTDNMPGTEGRKSFETFLNENGIEEVGRYHRWAYYRKKNDGTPFELFNSTAEELAHANKIKNLATVIVSMMIILTVVELVAFMHNPLVMWPAMLIVGICGMFVYSVYRKCSNLVKELETEVRLFE